MTPPLDLPKNSDLPGLVAGLVESVAALTARVEAVEGDHAVVGKVARLERDLAATRVEMRRLRDRARRR